MAARLLDGMTSKEIGKALVISHRTVEIYRARLMRKYKASTTADLVHKLMAGVTCSRLTGSMLRAGGSRISRMTHFLSMTSAAVRNASTAAGTPQ